MTVELPVEEQPETDPTVVYFLRALDLLEHWIRDDTTAVRALLPTTVDESEDLVVALAGVVEMILTEWHSDTWLDVIAIARWQVMGALGDDSTVVSEVAG